jgi:glycyl-tRNA synthetase (class II)
MAEIEHFVDPTDKAHDRFDSIKDIKLNLLPKDVQSAGKTDLSDITIGEAVASVCPVAPQRGSLEANQSLVPLPGHG